MNTKKFKRSICLFSILLVVSILSCNKDDNDEVDDPIIDPPELEYLDYYGSWEITDIEIDYSVFKEDNFRELQTVQTRDYNKNPNNAPNLKFYKKEEWAYPAMITDDGSRTMEAGNYLGLKWAVANLGDETFTGYIGIEVNLDGDDIATLSYSFFEILNPNHYYVDFWGSDMWHPEPPIIEEGSHTLKLKITGENMFGNQESNLNDNEYTFDFYATGPEFEYTHFEFSQNRYIITDKNGIKHYGELNQNYSQYVSFENLPFTISTPEVDGETITFRVSGATKSPRLLLTGKLVKRVRETDLTLRLMDGPWLLVETSHGNPAEGEKWNWLPGGSYTFENKEGEAEIYRWSYRDEYSINYFVSSEGVATINSISNDNLSITDYLGYTYKFSK